MQKRGPSPRFCIMCLVQEVVPMGGSKLKPWHIVVFVLAGILILWRVGAYTVEARKATDVKEVKGEFKNPAPPGTKTHQMFEEK